MTDLAFSVEEYEARLLKLQSVMTDRGLDAVVVDQQEHLMYLTGYLPTAAKYQAAVVFRAGEPVMIVRNLDLSTFNDQSWVESYVGFADHADPVELLCRVLRERLETGSTIGFELDSNFLTVLRWRKFRQALDGYSVMDFSGALWEMRLYKSESEVAYLRAAAHIADKGLLTAFGVAREGVSEREVLARAYEEGLSGGADNGRIALSASGALSSALHGRPGTRTLSPGDVLHLEVVPQVRGYSARIMRSGVVGKPTARQSHIMEQLIAIQNEQITAMVPGARAIDVDKLARAALVEQGLCPSYGFITGYTLGLHAQPRTSDFTRTFNVDSDWILQPHMVFHMYLAVSGMAISESVLVGDTGPERLTQAPRELLAI